MDERIPQGEQDRMRYDSIYDALAERATDSASVDVRAFMKKMIAAGVPLEKIEEQMLEDLETGGPLFGKFFRALTTAATSSVRTAYRQGQEAALLVQENVELQDWIDEYDLEDRIAEGDPEALEEIERLGGDIPHQWICTLKKTCYRCLPLHGKILTLDEWRERNLHPDTIHPEDWSSECYCVLVPTGIVEKTTGVYGQTNQVKQVIDPLVRNKDVTGMRGGKKTVRGVTKMNIDAAQAAVTKALESPEGRKILSMLGRTDA